MVCGVKCGSRVRVVWCAGVWRGVRVCVRRGVCVSGVWCGACVVCVWCAGVECVVWCGVCGVRVVWYAGEAWSVGVVCVWVWCAWCGVRVCGVECVCVVGRAGVWCGCVCLVTDRSVADDRLPRTCFRTYLISVQCFRCTDTIMNRHKVFIQYKISIQK